jgi:hypothetical protein
MPTENKSNKIITIVLAVIITLAAITVIYISLPQNKENKKTSGGNNEQQGESNETATIFTVIYGDDREEYSPKGLEALESYEGMGGYRTSFPAIKGQGTYIGVPVKTLVESIAGNIDNYSVIVHSSDGKNTTFNFSMTQGNANTYNSTNASISNPIGNGGVTMVVAYKKDGSYFNESTDGKLKIAFVNKDEELITSSKFWIKFVVSLQIIPE